MVNPAAKFHIPTPDEWYKAAFYSPQLNSGRGGYYVFATQHDATPGSVPGNDISQRSSPNQANYFSAGFSVTQATTPSPQQNYLTDGGAFSNSASYYGTFDQAGNVYEWNDDRGSRSRRSLRGGYWVSNVADTSYLDAYILPPDYESRGSGFRLASKQPAKGYAPLSKPGTDRLTGGLNARQQRSSASRDLLTEVAINQRQGHRLKAAPSHTFHPWVGEGPTATDRLGLHNVHAALGSGLPSLPSFLDAASRHPGSLPF